MIVRLGTLLTVYGHATREADPGRIPAGPRCESPYRYSHGRCVLAAAPSAPLYIVQELIVSLDAVG